MKKILLSIAILLLSYVPAAACAFHPTSGPFFPIIKNDDSMIARGKLIEKKDTYLVIELHEVYRGDETRCKIKIFNKEDWNCTGIVVDFELYYFGEVGQTFLFHADKVTSVNHPWEELGEYRNMYPRIGNAELPVGPPVQVGDEFRGWLDVGLSSIKLAEIPDKLVEYEVQDLLPFSRPLCGIHPLNIYPNPAADFFFLNDEIGDNAELNIYNTRGQLVISNTQVAKDEKVLISHLASGIYIISVKTETTTFQQKLLVR